MSSALLLLGPEEGQKSEYLDELRAGLAKRGDGPPEEHKFYAFETSADQVVQLLRNGSLFSGNRLVIYAGVEQLTKAAEVRPLVEYLKNPSPDATLVLTSTAIKVHSELQKVIDRNATKIFWEMFDSQKVGWVSGYLRRKGVRITEAAAEFLLEMVENNTNDLKQACDGVALVAPEERPVDVDDIEEFIYHSKQENVFTLFEHIAARDLQTALESLNALVLGGEGHPAALLAGILWQVRRVLALQRYLDDHHRPEEACRLVGIRGRRNQKLFERAAKEYRRAELEAIVALIADYEEATRQARPVWHRLFLEIFLYDVIVRRGNRPQSYRPEMGSYL